MGGVYRTTFIEDTPGVWRCFGGVWELELGT